MTPWHLLLPLPEVSRRGVANQFILADATDWAGGIHSTFDTGKPRNREASGWWWVRIRSWWCFPARNCFGWDPLGLVIFNLDFFLLSLFACYGLTPSHCVTFVAIFADCPAVFLEFCSAQLLFLLSLGHCCWCPISSSSFGIWPRDWYERRVWNGQRCFGDLYPSQRSWTWRPTQAPPCASNIGERSVKGLKNHIWYTCCFQGSNFSLAFLPRN